MNEIQEYNCMQLLKFIEGVKHFNPWIAQCILNFINENDSIKIDLEYVSPNEVNMNLVMVESARSDVLRKQHGSNISLK